MSEVVIKKLRKKISNSQSINDFATPIPIGSQGHYIDMLSKLDLEEQLKIGGNKVTLISNHYVPTSDDPNEEYNENDPIYTQILEYYSDQIITTTDLEITDDQVANKVKYTVETLLYMDDFLVDNYIIIPKDPLLIEEREVLNNGTNPIVDKDELFKGLNTTVGLVIINIYSGYKTDNTLIPENVLHQKIIKIVDKDKGGN